MSFLCCVLSLLPETLIENEGLGRFILISHDDTPKALYEGTAQLQRIIKPLPTELVPYSKTENGVILVLLVVAAQRRNRNPMVLGSWEPNGRVTLDDPVTFYGSLKNILTSFEFE
jgi:hypothetical protein